MASGSVNYLKPKVFRGPTSIRRHAALGKKIAAARTIEKAEFAYAKGGGAICLRFRQRDTRVRRTRRRAVQLTPKLFCG